MIYFLYFVLLFSLGLSAWEDITQRAIHWYVFPCIFFPLLSINFLENIFGRSLHDFFFIFLFISAQLLIASLYLWIKEKRPVNIFKDYIGLGDFLFLISISIGFSPLNFIAFYILSLLIILILFTARALIARDSRQYQIPLAGGQAIIYIGLLTANMIPPYLNYHNDQMIISYASMVTR